MRNHGRTAFFVCLLIAAALPASQAKPTASVRFDRPPTGKNLQSAYLLRDSLSPPWGHGPRPPLEAHFADALRILASDTEHSLRVALDRLQASQEASWTVEDRAVWRQRLAAKRGHNLAVLREYQARGLFPINDQDPMRAIPIFVDRHDTACAVGYLMRQSGAGRAVAAIVQANNAVYVTDVHDGPLVDWIVTSGLTHEEAALIQPGYPPPPRPPVYLSTYYTHWDGTITITGYIEPDGTIPDSIDGLPVTRIEYGAFWGRDDLNTVAIPDSITDLGDAAFAWCSSLTSVTIPNSITSIGVEAFTGCSGLTNVTIPNRVTSIERLAFSGCSSLTNVTIPNSVTSIGEEAFAGCSSLTAIVVDSLNSTYDSLEGVLFNQSQTTLIRYPPGKVGRYTIPDSVTSIADGAFRDCSGLTSVTIPNSVTTIAYDEFSGCSGLTAIVVDPFHSTYSSLEGVLFNQSQTTLVRYPLGKAGRYMIPDSVTSIGGGAFRDCSGLTSVTIPNRVTTIADDAFSGCSGLTAIVVDPLNATYSSLEGVLFNQSQTTLIRYPLDKAGRYTIPNSVTTIAYDAFSGCSGLTSVTIPSSVTSIGDGAFRDCSSLTAIVVDPLNSTYGSLEGVLFNQGQTTLIQYPLGKAGRYTIPNSVTYIAQEAFAGCSGLTSVTIPNSVTDIAYGAFSACSGLTSVTIPSSVTSIGHRAFRDCNGLTSVTIPNSVTRLGDQAFSHCSGLKGAYFEGEPPGLSWPLGLGSTIYVRPFLGTDHVQVIVYYLPGTPGWENRDTFADRPTALWQPRIQVGDARFGVRENHFGFDVAWAPGQVVVTEASTDPTQAVWTPLQTNVLTGDLFHFSDPQWTNQPARFYRLRAPY